MFQKTVQRQFTKGFVGEVVRDGVLRAKPGRIESATLSNGFGLVYGFQAASSTYAQQTGSPGLPEADKVVNTTRAASGTTPAVQASGLAGEVFAVVVGGAPFFGILAHPKHNALSGTPNGSLDPTYTLPIHTEAEFVDCCSGLVIPLYATETANQSAKYGDRLMYATADYAAASIPKGGITLYAEKSAGVIADGFAELPGAFIIDPVSVAKGSSTVASFAATVIQITN